MPHFDVLRMDFFFDINKCFDEFDEERIDLEIEMFVGKACHLIKWQVNLGKFDVVYFDLDGDFETLDVVATLLDVVVTFDKSFFYMDVEDFDLDVVFDFIEA